MKNDYFTSISVTFSGSSPKLYSYYVNAEVRAQLEVGSRVVVPTKMKEDGTVSLTIATVAEIHNSLSEAAVKPIVQVIDPAWIEYATMRVAELEASERNNQ